MNTKMSDTKRTKKIITTKTQNSTRTSKSYVGLTKEVNSVEMLFKKQNFYFVIGGLVIMAIGFVLMAGGDANPSPDVFDADSLYSFRRVFLAPLVILIGLALNIYAIFKK